MKTLYVTDLDGTLLTKNECVSAYSIAHLNEMIASGLLFTFATARAVGSARSALSGLALTAPAIFYNGALVYDFKNKEPLRVVSFEEENKAYILNVLNRYGIRPFVFGVEGFQEKVSWEEGSENPGMQRYLSRRAGDSRMHPVSSRAELLSGTVFYFKCIGPKEQLESAWNLLKYDPRYLCIFHQETYQNDFWMEISLHEANKAKSVTFLKEALSCDRLITFGDSSNDSDMFDVSDEKYAVRNADEWLKEKATGVIGFCEEDGVAKWLEENAFRR